MATMLLRGALAVTRMGAGKEAKEAEALQKAKKRAKDFMRGDEEPVRDMFGNKKMKDMFGNDKKTVTFDALRNTEGPFSGEPSSGSARGRNGEAARSAGDDGPSVQKRGESLQNEARAQQRDGEERNNQPERKLSSPKDGDEKGGRVATQEGGSMPLQNREASLRMDEAKRDEKVARRVDKWMQLMNMSQMYSPGAGAKEIGDKVDASVANMMHRGSGGGGGGSDSSGGVPSMPGTGGDVTKAQEKDPGTFDKRRRSENPSPEAPMQNEQAEAKSGASREKIASAALSTYRKNGARSLASVAA